MTNYCYLRVSHEDSLEGLSYDTQEKRCRSYAELHNFKIDKVFSDLVSGAVDFKKRKNFQNIYFNLKKGDRLVVSRLDRLGRSVLQVLNFVELLRQKKVSLHFTDIGEVTGDGLSRVFITILSSLAEVERINISERVKATKSIQKKERKFLGGHVEFAYSVDCNGKYVPNDKEQKILQAMINLRKHGLTYRKIADEVQRKFARKLHHSFVYKVLMREYNLKMYGYQVADSKRKEFVRIKNVPFRTDDNHLNEVAV